MAAITRLSYLKLVRVCSGSFYEFLSHETPNQPTCWKLLLPRNSWELGHTALPCIPTPAAQSLASLSVGESGTSGVRRSRGNREPTPVVSGVAGITQFRDILLTQVPRIGPGQMVSSAAAVLFLAASF